MFTSIRQLLHPAEFRLHPLTVDDAVISLIDEITRLMRAKDDQRDNGKSTINRVMAEVGTGLWRLRKKIVQPGTNHPYDEMRGAYRHLESVWDVLSQNGLQIRDHTDELVPETGTYALKVITYQPTPGLSRERVIETIKPSVYWNSDTLQVGEVVVGTPVSST